MVAAGVPQAVAQEYTGHETASIFQRYNIVDEASLMEQAGKLEAYRERARESVREKSGKVAVKSSGKVENAEGT